MLSNRSSSKYIVASLQTNMAKSQIFRVDIRIRKRGLNQGQTKISLGKHFFITNYQQLFKKYENLCLKDTFGKNLQKKGTVYHGYLAIYPAVKNTTLQRIINLSFEKNSIFLWNWKKIEHEKNWIFIKLQLNKNTKSLISTLSTFTHERWL